MWSIPVWWILARSSEAAKSTKSMHLMDGWDGWAVWIDRMHVPHGWMGCMDRMFLT